MGWNPVVHPLASPLFSDQRRLPKRTTQLSCNINTSTRPVNRNNEYEYFLPRLVNPTATRLAGWNPAARKALLVHDIVFFFDTPRHRAAFLPPHALCFCRFFSGDYSF